MMLRSFGASPTESCNNVLSLLPVRVGGDLGLGGPRHDAVLGVIDIVPRRHVAVDEVVERLRLRAKSVPDRFDSQVQGKLLRVGSVGAC